MTKVAERSAASEAMVTAGAKGRALMGGTTAMRAGGETYLPRFEAESADGYKARLNSSFLFNGYRKTVRDNTGRVFSKSVELGKGASPRLVEWCENVDMQGRDLSTFALEVFKDGIGGAGISYIMVDSPPRDATVTKAQASAQNLRPYMVHLKVEHVLGWKTATIDNRTVLSMLRIAETVEEPNPEDEFADITVDQVRVLTLVEVEENGAAINRVSVRIYRKNDKGEDFIYDEYMSQAREITVVPFYANRTGFFTGEPLLDDMADTNIAHWQSQSDQRNILHSIRVPILHISGRSADDGPIVIASNMATQSSDPAASMAWVEHSGKAAEVGRQDLKDLEFQMEALGMQLVAVKVNQSATGAALDGEKETSTLGMAADSLKDALEQAMIWMNEYGGESGSVDVTVNKDFGVTLMSAQEFTAMLTAVNTGNMTRATFLRNVKRRGWVEPDLDIDAEIEAIEDEDSNLMVPPADE